MGSPLVTLEVLLGRREEGGEVAPREVSLWRRVGTTDEVSVRSMRGAAGVALRFATGFGLTAFCRGTEVSSAGAVLSAGVEGMIRPGSDSWAASAMETSSRRGDE